MQPRQPKLLGVQYMRAIASLMVLVGHVIAEAEHYLGVDFNVNVTVLERGVDVFFVLSGFIIMLSAQKYFDAPQGIGLFLRNRFTRVVPLYWFFTTLMLAVLIVMPSGAKDTQLDWGQVISSYLFIPYERYDGRAAPILSLGWTLNFEIFFYALFALALAMPRKIGPMVIVAAMVLWTVVGATVAFFQDVTVLRVWSNSLILEFCFGVLIGHIYVHHWQGLAGRNLFGLVGLLIGAVLLVLFNRFESLDRWLASGLPATIMVGSMVFFWHQTVTPNVLSRLGLLLGDSSYALYLSHRFALRALTLVIGPLIPTGMMGATVFVVIACSMAVVGSIIVFYLIEGPLIRAVAQKPSFKRVRA